jgi:superfamily II DNA or RNA helicase
LKPLVVERSGSTMYVAPDSVQLAREYGWMGNTARRAHHEMQLNLTRARGQKVDIWGGDLNHPYHPSKIFVWAIQGMGMIQKIKAFVHNFPRKIDVAEQLINAFDKRTIVFAELTKTANELSKRLGDKAVVYHTKVTKKQGVSAKDTKKEALRLALSGEKKILLSAKAVDEGLDWPEAEFGLGVSRTSNPLQQLQRRGRISRKHVFADGTEKEAVFVNLYVKDTRDVKWLSNAQERGKGLPITWVETVREILELEREIAEGVGN